MSTDIAPAAYRLLLARAMMREVGEFADRVAVLDHDGRLFDHYMHWLLWIYGTVL